MTDKRLARNISLPLLVFYGLGTILGAGIYVLVGKIAGASGLLAPLAFLVAAIVAGITALSYCQLVVFIPKSSGESNYVDAAFNQPWLTRTVGLLVVFTGIVSCATLANGFVGYLQSFIEVPKQLAIIAVVSLMTTIALWGIAESLWIAALITIVEIAGLVLVVSYGGSQIELGQFAFSTMLIPSSFEHLAMVFTGAFLAFYAFIGFEDMVNIVEEVKAPEKNMPRAIVVAMLSATAIYILVAIVAILAMPIADLAASNAPLRSLLELSNPSLGQWISIISLFAIINGVLTQIIMASRVLYGMAKRGKLPSIFAAIHPKTQTPWVATLAIGILVLAFSLALPLVTLASYTSFVVLCVFTLVNISLFKLQGTNQFKSLSLTIPAYPLLGALLCIALLAFQFISKL